MEMAVDYLRGRQWMPPGTEGLLVCNLPPKAARQQTTICRRLTARLGRSHANDRDGWKADRQLLAAGGVIAAVRDRLLRMSATAPVRADQRDLTLA